MQLADIPDEVVDAARERGFSDDAIENLSPQQLFNEYCQWEGLINYGYPLWEIVTKLKKAARKDKSK
jgi:hypothetical protein